MSPVLGFILGAAACLILLESCVRLHRWRQVPLRLRLLYALFLLNSEAVQAITEIHQRVARAGARSFGELFELYALASGKSKDEIEALFGFRIPWRKLIKSKLVLRHYLQWHIGLVPLPDQRLRTATITSNGTRSTGSRPRQYPSTATVKHVAITGGSVPYGYGATSDAATIAGRLEYYLHELDHRDTHRWEVVNYAFPAATSFQELIIVLQKVNPEVPPDYLISLSGCNDVDQQFGHSMLHVSALTQSYTNALQQEGLLAQPLRVLGRRMVLLTVLRRFVRGYQQWPGPSKGKNEGLEAVAKPIHNEIDQPDIYPLW